MAAPTFNDWRLVSLAPWGRVGAVLALVGAAAILALALREARREPRRGRAWALVALRAGAVAAALTLFFEPAVQLENVTRLPNHVAVLVDRSLSMSLRETPGKPSRAERAAQWIKDSQAALERLRRRHILDFYTFGDRLTPSTEEALERGVTPDADATRIDEALSALRARYPGNELGGALVISDGIDNGRLGHAGSLDAESRALLSRVGAPVHTAWVGRPGLKDLAITRVDADSFAFVHTAVQIDAVLHATGVDSAGWDGRTLQVTLRRDGVPIANVPVALARDKVDYPVTFTFSPERVGKYVYEISAPVLPGEAIVENNARAFLLKVIRDKIRVLQVAGRPSWDERFLRGLLKRDPNVDLISFFILRTPTNLELVAPDELSLIPFPTEELFQEQLRSFDVVFLQNFNYGPYGIGAYLEEIRSYVEEGGALAMLGGDLSFASGGYAHTPVGEILPVELPDGGAPDQLFDLRPFRLALTPQGRRHPLTALRYDLDQNAALWGALPELEGTNVVVRARPGATVLGVDPLRKDADGQPMPVLTVGEAGKGRVLALTSDDSWRWGFGAATVDETERGRAYQKFWESAMRWLIRDPAFSYLRITTDQNEYAPHHPVTFDVRALKPDYTPLLGAELSVQVTRIPSAADSAATNAAQPVLARAARTDASGEAHFELDPPGPGGYRITARATLGGRPAEQEEVFLVRGASRELERPEARSDLLRAVSSATGGSFRGPGDSLAGLEFLPPRVLRVNRRRSVALWSRWWVLVLGAGCLAIGWALRRKWGYA